MGMSILLIGNGGREHALAWSLQKSPLVDRILTVTGNGGTALEPKVQNILDVSPGDFQVLAKLVLEKDIDLVIPGPEAPLVDGIIDHFRDNVPARVACFGPSKAAARMEGSKAFAKEFMKRHRIPTAASETFEAFEKAKGYLQAKEGRRVVIKADGLAAGKGVIMPQSHGEAVAALESIMINKEFGGAGQKVVIEEFLEGEELSILSFCDGYAIRSLPPAQDHKRALDNDQGKNTGGMGCYAPTQLATPELVDRMHREILQPTIDGMRNEGFPMIGCLFTGFMITPSGPKCLEYNVRFGDPETQTLLPLLDSDLVDVMLRCTRGTLSAIDLKIKPDFSTTVVVAAGGYPDSYEKGTPMTLEKPPEDTYLFHAGTTSGSSGDLRTSGGRVIASTAIGSSIPAAVEKAYTGVRKCIRFDGMHYRTDIARRELEREKPPMPQPPATHSQQAPQSHTADEHLIKANPPRQPPQDNETPLTYSTSGVSLTSATSLITAISPLVSSTRRPGSTAQIGGFGGLFSLPLAGYHESPTLCMAIDGIGTKLLLAQAVAETSGYKAYHDVGIDLVAMNVNDLLCVGAEPLAFLDYYACGTLSVPAATAFVSGVVEGCKQANVALVGGETAEMPGLYRGKGEFDAAGAAVGALAKGREALPRMAEMGAGDVLLGVGSSGVHSNGFSLVRKIVERSRLDLEVPVPWDEEEELPITNHDLSTSEEQNTPQTKTKTKTENKENKNQTLGETLLTPTRIYVQPILQLLCSSSTSSTSTSTASLKNKSNGIKGVAHITGGSLLENIPRILPAHLTARIDATSWTLPPVFKWLKKQGNVETQEMCRVFNCGIGLVLVVDRGGADEVVRGLGEMGERAWVCGEVMKRGERGEGGGEGCVVSGTETW